MKAIVITARRPADVAGEVEALAGRGFRSFAIAGIDSGGLLDRERMGAARYAAGLQLRVELELPAPAAAADPR